MVNIFKNIVIGISLFNLFLSYEIQIGLDVFEKEYIPLLKDKRIALLVNHTSLSSNGKHIIDIIHDNNLNIIRIFAPEDGYLGNHPAGYKVIDNIDPITGCEVISLYGKNKSPTDKQVEDIDIIIFDIQDIGVRYYTYISTLTLVMEKAAEHNIDLFVLDRPNPLSGKIEGPLLNTNYSSFVGMHPIPIRHGMTVGEIALLIKKYGWIKNSEKLMLKIIRMNGWDRSRLFDEYYKEWNPPSPNIPNFKTALIYVGTCLLEGTNISEGRGTNFPYKVFGAPWLDNKKLISALNKYNFKGVIFSPENFTPIDIKGKALNPKYENILCNGVRIKIINKSEIQPFLIGASIIYEIHRLHPDKFKFKDDFFDKLYGSNRFRENILESKNINGLIDSDNRSIERFKLDIKGVLLY